MVVVVSPGREKERARAAALAKDLSGGRTGDTQEAEVDERKKETMADDREKAAAAAADSGRNRKQQQQQRQRRKAPSQRHQHQHHRRGGGGGGGAHGQESSEDEERRDRGEFQTWARPSRCTSPRGICFDVLLSFPSKM